MHEYSYCCVARNVVLEAWTKPLGENIVFVWISLV